MRGQDAEAITALLEESQHYNSFTLNCGLQGLVVSEDLTSLVRVAVSQAIESGFTLCSSLPAIDNQLLTEWVGKRWYLVHRKQLTNMPTWSALVASRLSRTDADFRLWPLWIESAMRSLARDDKTLLLVPGTSTAGILEPLVQQAHLERLVVRWPNGKPHVSKNASIGNWLIESMRQITANQSVAHTTLFVSMAYGRASLSLEELPLPDRLLVALSHSLMALAVRPRGNVARLLSERLQDTRFPVGTVSYRVPSTDRGSDLDWLDRRAVGWYLPSRMPHPINSVSRSCFPLHCRANQSEHPHLVQWTSVSRLLAGNNYLIHCVRGSNAEAFRGGDCAAVVDAIAQGGLSPASPYETLLKIVAERRLRASGKLLRTGTAAVSFTAVALPELMARRRYQSHLGRWDWEPFGLMIRRDDLARLGARPVVYGEEELFETLGAADRHYFQPSRRRSARSAQEHWQAEQEWRLLDDLRLSKLSPSSVILFVETASQAQALAAHGPWPVICLQADRTQRSPSLAARGRRSSARTSRN